MWNKELLASKTPKRAVPQIEQDPGPDSTPATDAELPHPTSGAGCAYSWDGTSPQKPALHLFTVFHLPVSSQPLCLSPNTQLSFPFRLISAQLSPSILPLIPNISLPSLQSLNIRRTPVACKHSSHPIQEGKLKGVKPLKNFKTICSALLPCAPEESVAKSYF